MTTFTNKELIKEIKERIGSLDVRDNIERRAYEIALASLEAEPVAKIIAHYPLGIDVGKQKFVQAIGELPDFGGHLFAAPPAAVVPDDASEPLAYAYKELTPEIMRNHLAVFERYGIAPNDSSTTIQALRIALDGIERSDAMLHGAEPVSQTYKLNELAGNSPVTPDGWVMVPKRLTAENGAKGALSGEFSETTFISCLECFGDDDCDTCDGSGRIEIKVPVTWSTIKSIWDKGIEYFAAKPSQEVK